MTEVTITNARIVTPSEVIENGSVTFEDGLITDISYSSLVPVSKEQTINAEGKWVLPGLIDTHSDAIEQEIQPRVGSYLPIDVAVQQLERKLISQGVTLIHHSLSMNGENAENWTRKNETVEKVVRTICNMRIQQRLLDNRIHLRLDIANLEAGFMAKELLLEGLVDQISFMDHTPGQGQYRDLDVQSRRIMQKNNVNKEESYRLIEERLKRDKLSFGEISTIASIANEKKMPIASHDDDTIEKLDMMEKLQFTISEFPVELRVAKEAKRRGKHIVMGAPNVLLGGSHSKNLSALEAIEEGIVDILCSDYYPPAMLQAAFILFHQGMPMHEAINMISINPAKALRIDHSQGSIERGKLANLILVEESNQRALIEKVFFKGNLVCDMQYQQGELAAQPMQSSMR